jgi:23S rRNA U2552 (ribose-2'-O)-methylase RlmE/FtsJ
MSIFLLPKIIDNIGNNDHGIYFKMSKNVPNVMISHSLYDSLCQTKIKIENNDFVWDNFKKLTNPFEFIHTIIPGYKMQVSKLTPLSRSFYKMVEMSTIFNLCNKNVNAGAKNGGILSEYVHNLSNNLNHVNDIDWYLTDNYYCDNIGNGNQDHIGIRGDVNYFNALKSKNKIYEKKEKTIKYTNIVDCNHEFEYDVASSFNVSLNNVSLNLYNDSHSDNDSKSTFKSFHLAEGPGGFIEAVAYIRKNKNDEYYGMTLINNDTKCPGWRSSKKFLEDNPNVIIEKGVDGTGNLLSRDNFVHCYNKYKNSMDLVTGDGGIDFSEDFNNQEYSATKLIVAQLVYALTMQTNNGDFVLKVFDTFSNAVIDILYLLSSLYKNVYIMKPQTSRNANSERYIICKGYNLNENKDRIDYIIEKIYNNFDNLNSNLYIETIFNFKYNRMFISKIEEINIIMGKKQIDNIITTLNLMMNKKMDKIDYYKKKHIQKCIKWCEKFDINFNKNLKSTNIFLSSN